MKRRWQIIFISILFLLFFLQLFRLIHRTIHHANHYPTLIGTYCFHRNAPLGYIENRNLNDEVNIQQCSLENIDACQHINNQTLLFRLHWSAGFTSELNNLLRAFIYAIKTRRRFLIDDKFWNYGSFSSFFNISKGFFSPWLPSSSYCLRRKFMEFINYEPDNKSLPEHLAISRDAHVGFASLNSMMTSFEENNQTLFMKRIVADYLWKTLNNETRNFIDQYLNQIQVNTITYGVHIRRGDKLEIEAKEISVEKYINGIEYLMSKYSENDSKPRVYVASDQYNIINQLEYLRPDWEFVQSSQTYLQSKGHRQSKFNALPVHIKVESTRMLLFDMEILSRVKYVVCTFSSNVCRFVQILRKQEPDTVLSLDHQWYPQ